MKKLLLFFITFHISVVGYSQSARQDIVNNVYLSAGLLTA